VLKNTGGSFRSSEAESSSRWWWSYKKRKTLSLEPSNNLQTAVYRSSTRASIKINHFFSGPPQRETHAARKINSSVQRARCKYTHSHTHARVASLKDARGSAAAAAAARRADDAGLFIDAASCGRWIRKCLERRERLEKCTEAGGLSAFGGLPLLSYCVFEIGFFFHVSPSCFWIFYTRSDVFWEKGRRKTLFMKIQFFSCFLCFLFLVENQRRRKEEAGAFV